MTVTKRAFSALAKLGIIIAITIAFFIGLLGTIYYSLRSREVNVPNIVGKDVLEGERALDQDGLNMRRRATRYSPDAKPNTILDQSPHAGEIIKVGQTVAVVVSRASAKEGESAGTATKETDVAPENKNTNEGSSETKNDNGNANRDRGNKSKRTKNSNNSNNANGNSNNLNRNTSARNTNDRNANNRNANGKPGDNRNGNANRAATNSNRSTNTGNRNTNTGRSNLNSNANKRAPSTAPSNPNRNRRVP